MATRTTATGEKILKPTIKLTDEHLTQNRPVTMQDLTRSQQPVVPRIAVNIVMAVTAVQFRLSRRYVFYQ